MHTLQKGIAILATATTIFAAQQKLNAQTNQNLASNLNDPKKTELVERENKATSTVSVKAPINVVKELEEIKFVELGEKIIAEYLPNIPEADREKFIATARELILDRNAGKSTPIIIIIKNNWMIAYGKALGKITNGRYDSAVEIQKEINNQAREWLEKEREWLEKAREWLKKDIEQAELLFLAITKGKSVERIQNNLAKQTESFARLVRKHKNTYQYKDEVLQLLEQLWVSIDN